jgi:hypothetical protein
MHIYKCKHVSVYLYLTAIHIIYLYIYICIYVHYTHIYKSKNTHTYMYIGGSAEELKREKNGLYDGVLKEKKSYSAGDLL